MMPAPEPRHYKYVSFRIWKSGWVAQVHVNGKPKGVGGIHKTQLAAATAAAKFLKVPVQDLRRQQPEPWLDLHKEAFECICRTVSTR